jgi:hypothetical protein
MLFSPVEVEGGLAAVFFFSYQHRPPEQAIGRPVAFLGMCDFSNMFLLEHQKNRATISVLPSSAMNSKMIWRNAKKAGQPYASSCLRPIHASPESRPAFCLESGHAALVISSKKPGSHMQAVRQNI